MRLFPPSIGIDLGTANTMVYVANQGVAVRQPSILLVDAATKGRVAAVGEEARYQMDRLPQDLIGIHPLKAGTVVDDDMLVTMLRYFMIRAIGRSYLSKPKAVVSVSCTLPLVQRKMIMAAMQKAGCGKSLHLVEKPFVAALGSGLPVYDPIGSLIVDIGAGTTDVAVLSLGGIVVAQSTPVGGIRMNEALVNYIKREFDILISDRVAEQVKLDLAAALPVAEIRKVRVRGRDLYSPKVTDIEFTSAQAYEALREPCRAILSTIQWVLERTPPELAADIMRGGIHLTGGGAKLFGMDHYIATETGIPTMVANEPEDCSILGIGRLLEDPFRLNAMNTRGFLEGD